MPGLADQVLDFLAGALQTGRIDILDIHGAGYIQQYDHVGSRLERVHLAEIPARSRHGQ